MNITFLGTGTSQGVPFIGCDCPVCTATDTRNVRLRTAVHIQVGHQSIVIDTGPDFRTQMLQQNIEHLDAILYTHSHKDHIAGMDDIRAYNYWQKKAIDIYCTKETLEQLKREFYYVFSETKYPGIPEVDIHLIHKKPFKIQGIEVIPILTRHYKMEVLGFRIGDFSYITDANHIEDEELEKVKGSQVLVLNALRKEPHISHFHLDKAIEIAQYINAPKTYFTHISHQLGLHEEVEASLPSGIFLAYDGLKLALPQP